MVTRESYSRYHSFLKIFSLVFLIVLVVESGVVFKTTISISQNTFKYLASVGVSTTAQVPLNDLNAITTKLTERERDLDAREKGLLEREIEARNFGTNDTPITTYILSLILFILTTLIVFNYYLDWMRSRKQYHEATA